MGYIVTTAYTSLWNSEGICLRIGYICSSHVSCDTHLRAVSEVLLKVTRNMCLKIKLLKLLSHFSGHPWVK